METILVWLNQTHVLFIQKLPLTLLGNLNLPPAKLGLLDVLDAEIAAAFGVDLSSVPRRGLVVRAVRVGGGWRESDVFRQPTQSQHKPGDLSISPST